jgi:hypothetical protein
LSGQTLSIGQSFLVRPVTTATFSEPIISESGFYGRSATPQEVGDFLRGEVLGDVLLLEKTLVLIFRKFRNGNGID